MPPGKMGCSNRQGHRIKSRIQDIECFLDDIQFKIHELQRRMSGSDELITAETFKNSFVGKAEKARTLVAIFEDHNTKMKSLVGREFEKSTL